MVYRSVIAVGLAVVLAPMLGCSAAEEASDTYHVDRCANYTGATATLALNCGDDQLVEAHCDGNGGQIYRRSLDGVSWSCEARWSDTAIGGTLCESIVCSRRAGDKNTPTP
jgi:hypothetical protein